MSLTDQPRGVAERPWMRWGPVPTVAACSSLSAQQRAHGLCQDRIALRAGEGNGGFVASLQVGLGDGNVAGAVVAIACDTDEVAFAHLLGAELILDERLAGEMDDLDWAEIETGDLDGPL